MVCQKNHTQVVPVYVITEHSLEPFFDPVQYAGALLQNSNHSFPEGIEFELEQVDSVWDYTLYELQNVTTPRAITIMMINILQKENLHFKGFAWKGSQENNYTGLIMLYLNPHDSFSAHLQTLVHELGHVYGLNHSLDEQGAMYPVQQSSESIYFSQPELDIILSNKRLYGYQKEDCECCEDDMGGMSIDNYFPYVMELALRYQNAPYQFDGIGNPGFDCSGLWMTVFQHIGIHLPRMVEDQYVAFKHIPGDQLQQGDFIFFTATGNGMYVSHVGMYVGANHMYNSNRKQGVGFTGLTPYWQARIIGYGRVSLDINNRRSVEKKATNINDVNFGNY
ncbi:NlpC/P60 family protein [Thermoactinomyces sp. DSM 45892]|uniref:NlpC/P60 family protein n=1 Tax=Thermoactinomyces sp. DSM 45892 TaxID=1882753 RepID=UPI000897D6F3|nr:NlpC/P60 family protein [Thermoactinomyces sp. DSM 45892]SDY29411.1 Matrixin [Thermoactinomyces sp. DSM 45892]